MRRRYRAGLAFAGLLAAAVAVAGLSGSVNLVGGSATSAPGDTPAAIDPDVAEAIAFRERVGLRADLAWVEAVGSDPAASTSYGIPLLPEEERELDRRSHNVGQIAPIVEAYAEAFPGEFGGMYVDQDRGGAVVVLFTEHLLEHHAALQSRLGPTLVFRVEAATVTRRTLRALEDQVVHEDHDVLAEERIWVISAAADEHLGAVRLELSTERVDAAIILSRRYGEHIAVTVVDATGAFLKPRGTIRGKVTLGDGSPVRATIGLRPLFANIGMDATGFETDASGAFVIEDVLSGRWLVRASSPDLGVGSIEVYVAPSVTVVAHIILSAAAPTATVMPAGDAAATPVTS